MIVNLDKVYKDSDLSLISHILSGLVEMVFLSNKEDRFYLLDLILLKSGLGNSDANWEINRLNNNGIVSYQMLSDPLFVDDGVSTYVDLTEKDFIFFLKNKMKGYSYGDPFKKKIFNEIIDRYNLR